MLPRSVVACALLSRTTSSFPFSKSYFLQCVQSEGWLNYITNFIIQFFYYPILGSTILAFLLASVYWLTNSIIKIITGKNDLLQLSIIPSLILFLYNGSESFSFYITRKSAMPVDALFASFVYSTLPKRISLFRLPGISNKKYVFY